MELWDLDRLYDISVIGCYVATRVSGLEAWTQNLLEMELASSTSGKAEADEYAEKS